MSVSDLALTIRGRAPASVDTVAWFEKAMVVVALLIFLGAFRTLLSGGGDDRTDGSTTFQLLTSAIYVSSMAVVLYHGLPTRFLPVLYRAWPLILLTLLPLVSTLWSQDPGPTFRRSIALLLSSWFVVYIAIRFSLRTFFNLLTIAFAIFIVVSILSVAVPGQGVTSGGTYGGAWRGLTGNKNEFGRTVALSVALMPAVGFLRLTDYRRSAVAVGLISVPLLFLSHSATSLVAAVLGLGLGTALYVLLGGRFAGYRLRAELRVVLALLTVVTGLVLFTVAWTPVLQALGRDPTLTGRTKLWQWALTVNHDRRWLGSGYRAFWIDDNTRYFFLTFAWDKDQEGARSDSFAGPTHSHSGYVDLILDLGYVGLSAFVVVICTSLFHLRRTLLNGNLQRGFIFAVITAFLLVYAITARSVLQQGEGLWSIFMLLYLFAIEGGLSAKTQNPLTRLS